jgi:hypothetical protein
MYNEDRETGIAVSAPRTDVERAMSHYGITATEYYTHPERYPLPERGSAVVRATFVAAPGTDLASWPSAGWGTVMQVALAGSITKITVKRGSVESVVPVSIPLGSSVEIRGYGLLSASSPATQCGMSCVIKKPDGTYLNGYNNMSTLQNPGQELAFLMSGFPGNNITIDQVGVWQAIFRYYTYP